ncbi:MAG: AMP-binding protein [Kiritimatiellae bacterium]|nr:AMP-binding protein [Kiritimatiellia bacterium]
MTIRETFERAVREHPDAAFQRFYDGTRWVYRTYREAYGRMLKAAAVVSRLDLGEADADGVRPRVAIMMENCPDWQILYLAITGAGLVVVPIDPKLRAGEVGHILADSGARAVFCGEKQLGVVVEAATAVGNYPIVKIENPSAVIDMVKPEAARLAEEYLASRGPQEDDLASLIYTSGTTGRPKGAMLTHRSFMANAAQTLKRVPMFESDIFLNVLPLFHAFSFMGNFILPMSVGASTGFIRNLRTIADDMMEIKPTILLAVPLLAEKLYGRIKQKIDRSVLTSGLFKFEYSRRLVAKLIVERFGGRMRLIGIGGAPTAIETLEGFRKIGLFVLEGYGITECAPGVAYPDPANFVPGTVGPVLDGIDWKLGPLDDTGAGELLVKGDNLMKGYWHNPEQTQEAFDEEGYYKTGDIVRIVDGNVKICGRSKALIVNREGKNIYPEEIEHALEHAPLIKDAIVIGYRVGAEVGEHVGAIVVPDEDAVRAHLKQKTLTQDEISAFIVEYAQGVCRASVADYKQPRKYDVRFEPLERTGTMKVKRAVYKGALDE